MRKFSMIILGFLLYGVMALGAQETGIDKVAARLASRIGETAGTTVAVADFTDLQGRVTELGRYYAEELSIALVNANAGLKVIDRGHLRTLLAEHRLESSGVIDERTATELGRIAGVTTLITGSVTEFPDSLRLTVKALNTKTASIQAADALSLPKSESSMALLRRDVTDAGAGQGVAAIPGVVQGSAGAANIRMFQNDFLIMGVDSISVRKGPSTSFMATHKTSLFAYLTLMIENKSKEDEFLGVKTAPGYSSGYAQVSLMDSLGRNWRFVKLTGLPIIHVDQWDKPKRGLMVRLAPGVRQPIQLMFSLEVPDDKIPSPTTASIAIEMVRYREHYESLAELFTVGFAGIPLAK